MLPSSALVSAAFDGLARTGRLRLADAAGRDVATLDVVDGPGRWRASQPLLTGVGVQVVAVDARGVRRVIMRLAAPLRGPCVARVVWSDGPTLPPS